jgi:bifunctional enzyme CysN/CysC
MTTSSQTPLRIVIVGHVDHGKSTLVGRLCHDTGTLPDGKLEQLQATCKKRGVPFEWAFVMDALQAERDQNITIDTSHIWFSTPKRPYVIIDAPGHEELIKNMVTGAASAHAALLLIAADEGVRAQSRRHAALLQLLGLSQLIVVVNKMDAVGWSQQTYDAISLEYRGFLSGLGITPAAFIPICARSGHGLARSGAEHMPWHSGPTVIEALDRLERAAHDAAAPLRLPLQDIYRFDERRILAGRVESGSLSVGDAITFWPGGKSGRVKSIERWPATDAPAQTSAHAGASVGFTLDDQRFAERGHLVTRAADPAPTVARALLANIFWLGAQPVQAGSRYRLKLATQEVDAEIVEVVSAVDAATLDIAAPADGAGLLIRRHQAGQVRIATRQPLALDAHELSPSTGRFVLVADLNVAGGGIVLAATPWDSRDDANTRDHSAPVTPLERAQRARHRGAVVLLNLRAEASPDLLSAIERALFERSVAACALTPRYPDLEHELRPAAHALTARTLAHAGLVCIASPDIAGQGAQLAAFRRLVDTPALATIAISEGRALPILTASARLPGEDDDARLAQDHDLTIPADLPDDAARVGAIIELLIPWLQRF